MLNENDWKLIRAFIKCDTRDFTPHRYELVDDALNCIKRVIPEDNKKDIVITSTTNLGLLLRKLVITGTKKGEINIRLCPCGQIEHYIHINEEEE